MYHLMDNTDKTPEGLGEANMDFPDRIDTIFTWTELRSIDIKQLFYEARDSNSG